MEVYLLIFDKLKQIFKGRDDEKNIAESLIEDNKEALDENIVYPESEGESSFNTADETNGSEEVDPDALFVPELNKSEKENYDEAIDLLNPDDLEEAVINQTTNETVDKVDYDAEIEELLRQDAETEIKDVDYEYINDISVYDIIRNDKEDVLAEIDNELSGENQEGEDKKDEGVNIFYVALIGILSVLIIAVVILIFIMSSLDIKGKQHKEVKEPDVIDVSSYKSNEANYIYLSQKGKLDDEEFELSKMLVDSKATLFYFKNKFDIQKYNIILSDNNNNLYGMDLSFIQNMSQDTENENGETILRFEPLALNAKSVKLSLYNAQNGKRLDFEFDFNGVLEETPVKYIFDENVESGNSDVKLNIDNAVFSSAGSTINYTIKSSGSGFSIVQDRGKHSESVILEEGATNIKKLKKYPSMYSFDNGNTILGRMDFGSTESLNSKIYFTFENLFKSYSVNRDIKVQSLYGKSDKDPISFDVGNYRVVLEGVGSYNDRIVLVMHGEDKNIKYDAENPNANRVEVRLDAQLVSQTASGMEIILDGSSQSAEYGTDMSFMINESNRDLIYSFGANNLMVRVNSALIKTDDVKCEFDLRKAKTEDDKDRVKASNDVIDTFKGRLAYKSGEKSIEAVNGFSDKLIKEGSILSEYQPAEITERAKYSAQIISSALMGDKFYAVVQEVWTGVNVLKENHFSRTHKIVAQKGDYFWTIIEDNVIK